MVDHVSYYRGVREVFARDQKAVGYLSVPHDQPPNLGRACCDPIAIDNFLQVAGIHVNCLSECKEDELFMCTAIRELLLSKNLMKTVEQTLLDGLLEL